MVWHPSSADGWGLAKALRDHFGHERFKKVVGNGEMEVFFQNEPDPGNPASSAIGWQEAEAVFVVLLLDAALVADSAWVRYAREQIQGAQDNHAHVIPVAMEQAGLDLGLDRQALAWYRWEGSVSARQRRFIRDLTTTISLMLRHRLSHPEPTFPEDALPGYLERIRVFIGHSKHDGAGEATARKIRDWLHANTFLDSFFDMTDLPIGLSFADVIEHRVKNSAVLALHTDSFSSREWCRLEVIIAKQHHVPMVVVDCLHDRDERSVPYLGNVPIIRMTPGNTDRIDSVVECLLDETLLSLMWQCRIDRYRARHPDVVFMPRPPELISLASLPGPRQQHLGGTTIVHPEPSLEPGEKTLFERVAPHVRTYTLTQWLEHSDEIPQ